MQPESFSKRRSLLDSIKQSEFLTSVFPAAIQQSFVEAIGRKNGGCAPGYVGTYVWHHFWKYVFEIGDPLGWSIVHEGNLTRLIPPDGEFAQRSHFLFCRGHRDGAHLRVNPKGARSKALIRETNKRLLQPAFDLEELEQAKGSDEVDQYIWITWDYSKTTVLSDLSLPVGIENHPESGERLICLERLELARATVVTVTVDEVLTEDGHSLESVEVDFTIDELDGTDG